MIRIHKSETADTRTCDFANVSKETLKSSSLQHIHDVSDGIEYFRDKLEDAAFDHDFDKITAMDSFHSDFIGGFESTVWYDEHRKINRHHIDALDGRRDDINLVDVIEHIVDCTMAGMARSGNVFPIKISNELLQKALANTVQQFMEEIEVVKDEEYKV